MPETVARSQPTRLAINEFHPSIAMYPKLDVKHSASSHLGLKVVLLQVSILVSIEEDKFLFTYKEQMMKQLILSLTLGSMVAISFAPDAFANRPLRQSSERSEDTSLVEFIRRNRDARSKS